MLIVTFLDSYCDSNTIKDIVRNREMGGSREMHLQYFWQQMVSLNDDNDSKTVNDSTDTRKEYPCGEILSWT